jgi:hypothetical protein
VIFLLHSEAFLEVSVTFFGLPGRLRQIDKLEVLTMSEKHLMRVRKICMDLPETWEKPSHGEPAFFVGKRMYAMFANNHHNDGHVAVWLPAPPGLQEVMITSEPEKFFRPPYVGVRGWVGIDLGAISDDELAVNLHEAWRLIAPKRLLAGQ